MAGALTYHSVRVPARLVIPPVQVSDGHRGLFVALAGVSALRARRRQGPSAAGGSAAVPAAGVARFSSPGRRLAATSGFGRIRRELVGKARGDVLARAPAARRDAGRLPRTDGEPGGLIRSHCRDPPTASAPLRGGSAEQTTRGGSPRCGLRSVTQSRVCTRRVRWTGSCHTAGPWPLGDLQEWIAASLLGEPGTCRRGVAARRARRGASTARGVIAAVAAGTLDLAAARDRSRPALLR